MKQNYKNTFNDRSKCSVCGIDLTSENAYKRNDTTNKLHALCRHHYLEVQKERAIRVKTAPYTYTVNRGSSKPFHLYFNTLEEKRQFINDRYIQESTEFIVSCISGADLRSSGCGPSQGEPTECDECGGKLQYDSRSLLICVECGLEANSYPFYRESPLPLKKGRHSWNGDMADNRCQDAFYSRAYNK